METTAWLQSLNMLDWLVVAVLGAGAWAGFKRGFILAFASLTGFFVALGAALLLTGRAVAFLDHQWGVLDRTRVMLLEQVPLMASVADADLTSVPVDEVLDRLRVLPLPDAYIDALRDAIYQAVPVAVSEGMVTFGEVLYHGMAAILVGMVTFVALFVVTRIGMRMLASMLHTTVSATPFSLANRVGGLALGAGHYALLVSIGLALLTPFLALPSFRSLALLVDESAVVIHLIEAFYRYIPVVTDLESWLLR